jgi:hypothetical protein
MKKTKYIRNGVQYNSADNVMPVPKYKSPPPRGKKKIPEPDVDMFEREEETPERPEVLLPVKRISKHSRLSSANDVANY